MIIPIRGVEPPPGFEGCRWCSSVQPTCGINDPGLTSCAEHALWIPKSKEIKLGGPHCQDCNMFQRSDLEKGHHDTCGSASHAWSIPCVKYQHRKTEPSALQLAEGS